MHWQMMNCWHSAMARELALARVGLDRRRVACERELQTLKIAGSTVRDPARAEEDLDDSITHRP